MALVVVVVAAVAAAAAAASVASAMLLNRIICLFSSLLRPSPPRDSLFIRSIVFQQYRTR